MSKPNLKRKRAFQVISVGALLLIVGVVLLLYTGSEIQSREQLLNGQGLTQKDRDTYEGALQWWRDAKRALFDPISMILITVGVCVLEYALIYVAVQF
jgi:hypothetical protein